MQYYIIDPDVPGRLDDETIKAFHSGQPAHIRYIFECWPASDIVQSDPVFAVSETLATELLEANLTGFTLKPCESRKGEQFDIASPGSDRLPVYVWLDVHGSAGIDDFGISEDLMLTISEKALKVLHKFNLEGSTTTDV